MGGTGLPGQRARPSLASSSGSTCQFCARAHMPCMPAGERSSPALPTYGTGAGAGHHAGQQVGVQQRLDDALQGKQQQNSTWSVGQHAWERRLPGLECSSPLDDARQATGECERPGRIRSWLAPSSALTMPCGGRQNQADGRFGASSCWCPCRRHGTHHAAHAKQLPPAMVHGMRLRNKGEGGQLHPQQAGIMRLA